MNDSIADFIKTERKHAGLTQEEFAIRSGLGLRFIRELEQGKERAEWIKLIRLFLCLEVAWELLNKLLNKVKELNSGLCI